MGKGGACVRQDMGKSNYGCVRKEMVKGGVCGKQVFRKDRVALLGRDGQKKGIVLGRRKAKEGW